ncbi:MAG: DUF3696 domain-containing protein [Ignavibacteriales bacterium]|nr:DUF3696 domain-containing protein [Ignavibacteriales bacterium]
MQISGDSVDLGGFNQIIYKNNYFNSLVFNIEIEIAKINKLKNYFNGNNIINMIFEIGYFLEPEYNSLQDYYGPDPGYKILNPLEFVEKTFEQQLLKIELYINGKKILNIKKLSEDLFIPNFFKLSLIDFDNETIKEIITQNIKDITGIKNITEEQWNFVQDNFDFLNFELYSDETLFTPPTFKLTKKGLEKNPFITNLGKDNETEKKIINYMYNNFPNLINEIIQVFFDLIENETNNFRYLGPMRTFPPRHLFLTNNNNPNWVAGGAEAWEIIKDNDIIREKINHWLADSKKMNSRYKIEIHHLIDTRSKDLITLIEKAQTDISPKDLITLIEKDQTDISLYDDLLEELGMPPVKDESLIKNKIFELLQRKELSKITDLVLIDQNTGAVVTHRDVGYGISQVIPVLVSAYGNTNKIIMIEQPEIHLHPALQAELGDVFLEAALGENKNRFILETHSEHLILRILRRIREQNEGKETPGIPKINPDDIQVLYAQPTSEGTKLIKIPITQDGDFAIKWPEGFFTERAKELF